MDGAVKEGSSWFINHCHAMQCSAVPILIKIMLTIQCTDDMAAQVARSATAPDDGGLPGSRRRGCRRRGTKSQYTTHCPAIHAARRNRSQTAATAHRETGRSR